MRIEIPLTVIGRGPAALVVAKVAAGCGLPCLLAGHEVLGDEAHEVPVALDADAVGELERYGLIDVLRPYLTAVSPPTIAPVAFEDVIKHHCVADLNVVVYDGMRVVERVVAGAGMRAVLTDGTSRWDLATESFVDADLLPTTLGAAIVAGAGAARAAVEAHRAATETDRLSAR